MAHEFDLIVRGGLVVDGTGAAPFEADVAVTGGRIASIGRIAGSGSEEIAANGQVVGIRPTTNSRSSRASRQGQSGRVYRRKRSSTI